MSAALGESRQLTPKVYLEAEVGFRAVQYVKRLTGLEPAQRLILYEISAWCMDETAFLDWNKEHLASSCGISYRTFERHFKVLSDLRLAVWSGSGFRLVEFWERQIGGQNDRQIGGQNGGVYKEGTSQNQSERTPPNPLVAEGEPFELQPKKLTREEKRRAAMRCERPEQKPVETHRCARCRTPHEWPCRGPSCSCEFGRVEWSCDLAMAGARSP